MAFTITALQLVNRVHRRRRMPDTGAFVVTEDLATLNAVNSAIETILSEKNWEFNLRTDGQLTLRARFKGVFAILQGNSVLPFFVGAPFSSNTLTDDDVFGDFVTRVLLDGDSGISSFTGTPHPDYSNTPLRMNSGTTVSGETTVSVVPTPIGPSGTIVHGSLIYSEYILPDTVSSVVRATYQERPLTLEQVDPKVQYSEIFPRPHFEFGPPEAIAVGGFDTPTFNSDLSQPDPGLRLAVHPVPDDEYIINYSYYFRHPEMTAITDTLDGVPPNIISKIVDMATADLKVFFEKDYEALAISRSVRQSTDDIFNSHGGSRSARKPIHNWDSVGRRGGVQRGFPGKLLGS